MAALETKREKTTSPADDAVFVSRDGRRARRLRSAAIVAGVLAILWVVGLAVGMLGFGSLPGVALVKGVASHAPPAEASALPAAKREVSRLLAADDAAARHRAGASTGQHAVSAVARRHRSSARKRSGRSAATPPAQNAAQAPVTQSPRMRGWSRRGYTAPRGQLRRVAPPPPPVTSRGRRVGPQKQPPAPPPPVSPGQAKKAELPPPPPPPPSKKG